MQRADSDTLSKAPRLPSWAWPRLWGATAVLLALGVLISRLTAATQATDSLPLGQFSSALAFALGGGALLLAAPGRTGSTNQRSRQVAFLLAALLWTLAVLRLVRLLTTPGDGVDQWLNHYLALVAINRTPLNAVASLGMLLWASSFLLCVGRRQAEHACQLQHIADLMVISHLAMAVVALVAHLARIWGLESSAFNPPFTVLVAIAHGVLALGLISLNQGWRTRPISAMFGWTNVAIALQLTLTMFGWVAMSHTEQQHRSQRIAAQSHWLQQTFVETLSNRTGALQRMVRRWEYSGGIAPTLWRDDAQSFVESLQGIQAIAYVDPTGRVTRIAPLAGNADALGVDLRGDDLRRRALDQARATGGAVYTAQITLPQGGQGFLLAHPLMAARRFDGWLCVVFRTEDLFAVLSRPVDDYRFSFEVFSAGRSVYRNQVATAPDSEGLSHTFAIPNGDGEWQIRLAPSQAAMAAVQSGTPSLLLTSGLLVTFLMALAFQLFERGINQRTQLLKAHQWLNALSAETRMLALVSKHTRNAVAITDGTGRCKWVNGAFSDITGFGPEQALGRDLCALLAPKTHTNTEALGQIANAIASGNRLNVELLRQQGNRAALWVAVEVTPVHDGAGTLSEFIVVGTDITQSKRVQNELDASQRFLRNLVDVMPGLVSYWDANLRCRFANSAYLEWYGRTPAQMQNISLQELLGPTQFAASEHHTRAVLRGKRTAFERAITKPDGTTGFVWTHYLPDTRQSDVHGYFVLASDITDIKQAQLQLEDLNLKLKTRTNEAETANRAKSEFLSSMSHELRTPMNAMLGFAQLIAMDAELPALHRDNVDEVLRAGKHLLSLINDLLSLAKIEAGHTELRPSDFDTADLVEECLALVRPMTTELGVGLECDMDGPMTFTTDRRLLKQVLINLLSNAIKYNRPQGFVRLTVAHDQADQICLTVSDSGVGIAPHNLNAMFQPFNRLGAEDSDIDGHGIGLAVCHRLVVALGGRIAVSSEEGVGSRFTVTLPQAPADVPRGVPAGHALTDGMDPAKLHSTILNIDDSPVNRRLVKGIMARHPHLRLLEAGSGEKGIDLARAHRPDLILMDIQLPGMDGVEALRQLRNAPETEDIPVVAVSAGVIQEQVDRVNAAGFDGHLYKPFELDEFMAVIHGLLHRDRRQTEL